MLFRSFAYTYWKNNSLQALGMEAVDAGIGYVADMAGGLGGSGSGAITSATNSITNSIGNGSAIDSVKSFFK